MTAAADAADLAAMATAIGKSTRMPGGLDSVIPAAGVPGNGRIAVLQDEQRSGRFLLRGWEVLVC